MIRTAHAAYFASLALWVGGLTALALVAAPAVFRSAPSRPVAGEIFGTVLRSFGYVEMACAALLIVATAVLHRLGPDEPWMKGTRLALVAAMVLLSAGYTFGINPAAAEERARIANFASLAEGDPARARFDRLHRWSVRLAAGTLLAGWALLLLSAANLKAAR